MINQTEFRKQVLDLMNTVDDYIDEREYEKKELKYKMDEIIKTESNFCKIFSEFKNKVLKSDKIEELETRLKSIERVSQSLARWS